MIAKPFDPMTPAPIRSGASSMGDSDNQSRQTAIEKFFDLSLDLMCVTSTDGYFRYVNPMFTTRLGYSPPELLAEPLHRVRARARS